MADTKEEINLLPEDIRTQRERELDDARTHSPSAPTILHAPPQKKSAKHSLSLRLKVSPTRFHIPWGAKKEDAPQEIAKASLPSFEEGKEIGKLRPIPSIPKMHERTVIPRDPRASTPRITARTSPSWWQKLMTPALHTQGTQESQRLSRAARTSPEDTLKRIQVQLPPQKSSVQKPKAPQVHSHAVPAAVPHIPHAPRAGFLARLIASWKARRIRRTMESKHIETAPRKISLSKPVQVDVPPNGQKDKIRKKGMDSIGPVSRETPHPFTVPPIPTKADARATPLPAVHLKIPASASHGMHRHIPHRATALAIVASFGVSVFLASLNWLAFQEVSRLAVAENELAKQIERTGQTLPLHEAAASPYLEMAARSSQLEHMLNARTALSPALSRMLQLAMGTGDVRRITVKGAHLEVVSVALNYEKLKAAESTLNTLATLDAVEITSLEQREDGSLVATYEVNAHMAQ